MSLILLSSARCSKHQARGALHFDLSEIKHALKETQIRSPSFVDHSKGVGLSSKTAVTSVFTLQDFKTVFSVLVHKLHNVH